MAVFDFPKAGRDVPCNTWWSFAAYGSGLPAAIMQVWCELTYIVDMQEVSLIGIPLLQPNGNGLWAAAFDRAWQGGGTPPSPYSLALYSVVPPTRSQDRPLGKIGGLTLVQVHAPTISSPANGDPITGTFTAYGASGEPINGQASVMHPSSGMDKTGSVIFKNGSFWITYTQLTSAGNNWTLTVQDTDGAQATRTGLHV